MKLLTGTMGNGSDPPVANQGVVVRSSRQLSSVLAEVVELRTTFATQPDYYNGCAAALEWVTGQRPPGPVSHDQDHSPDSSVDGELHRSIAMLQGEEAMGPFSRAYASGVEATLAWVVGSSEEPPL